MDDETRRAVEEWIASKPECVQKLIAEFPIGSRFNVHGEVLYILGYTENDMLIVSPVDPSGDYESANEQKKYLCASHFRNY